MFPFDLKASHNVSEGNTIEEKFKTFHAANPHIYEYLKSITIGLKISGMGDSGARSINLVIERLKWICCLQGVRMQINNAFKSHYARKLNEEPMVDNFFHVRGEAKPVYNGEPLPFGAENEEGRE